MGLSLGGLVFTRDLIGCRNHVEVSPNHNHMQTQLHFARVFRSKAQASDVSLTETTGCPIDAHIHTDED
jgi:hypothetical protein